MVTNSASSCGTIEIPLDMEDPFAIAYNPVSNYVYVLRSGTTESQVAVLRYGREVARIDFPPSGFSELTSIGANPSSGLTYVTQWGSDRVHFISDTQVISSYSTGYWGPAGVWSSTSNSATYVSGKWVQSTSKVVYFGGTAPIRVVDVGFNANPNAGIVATNSQYLYLANSYSNTVSVLNSGSLLATIKVGDHPNGIAYNPTNGYIYAVNRGTTATQSTVSVISGTAMVATIPLGPGYGDYLGVHPKDAITINRNVYRGGTDIVTTDPRTGYVYVSNWDANTVSVISGTVLLATVPVGVHPNSIAYNPVTGLVYVANTGDDTVTLIEGTNVVNTVSVGDYPIDLAVDTHSGLVYAVNRESDSLSIIRCEDNLHEKRVLGHYMTWYKTKESYGEGCFNPEARGDWGMWRGKQECEHNPDIIIDILGFRDIAAVHYPLTGPYDSADPKVIEYHLLQALAAEIDTFVIDFYGENDAGGIDEAALRALQQVEEMNARYDTNFKIALMYDEGALQNQPDPVIKATSDFAYMLRTYASSPAYLWANGKPVMFYFPKDSILTPAKLAAVAGDFSLVYPDFPPDYLSVMSGSYAWVKAEPWEEDCSNWGEPYLRWYYPTLDFMVTTVPTLTFGVGAAWAGFDDVGVGREWWCVDHRCIDRQGGQVYDRTWDILDGYNDSVGITYTVPISWVQLVTLNDYMEGTELFPTVQHGHQYVQQTEDHAREFKGLPADDRLDIYVAQHIYNARLLRRVFLPLVLRNCSYGAQYIGHTQVASGTRSNIALIDDALEAFHSGHYTEAIALADVAAGIPAPTNVTAVPAGCTLTVCWQDQPGAWLASGHRVYYGLTPGEYISSTTVSTDSCVTLSDVVSNTTYYIAITTLGATNPCETWYVSESWYSDEIAVQMPASLTHNHSR